jgi:hypothetical protein
MNVFLMHEDRDLDLEAPLQPQGEVLEQDLELGTLFDAMTAGDERILDVVRRVVLVRDADLASIGHRQAALRDCLDRPDVVRGLYELAVSTLETERRRFLHLSSWSSPDTILSRSVQVLGFFVEQLKALRSVADRDGEAFASPGFRRFFSMVRSELDDAYFGVVDALLAELAFRGGVPMSARVGRGNKGTDYALRTGRSQRWLERLIPVGRRTSLSFEIPPRDEGAANALAELRARGIDIAADVLARSNDHVLAFFQAMRDELAFYVGCLNLRDRLADLGHRICLPEPAVRAPATLVAGGLYDPCLALTRGEAVVSNDVRAEGKSLLVITGANQGGKSTFLRSLGLGQLMMQAGMFVAADGFRADVRDGIFTHYTREEDARMERGRLDEELARMSAIIDDAAPGSLVLCNESFASTNEREGSEMAREVVHALTSIGIKVVFVTHLFELTSRLFDDGREDALFLRAERRADGTRSFRVVEGRPLPTSFGQDLYRRIFGAADEGGSGGSPVAAAEAG